MVILTSIQTVYRAELVTMTPVAANSCRRPAGVLHCSTRTPTREGVMFEEGQLYSPVTHEDGEVTVHLAHDHPGANDPHYRRRRNEIARAALAWEPGQP